MKKIVSLTLALLLIVAMIAGCRAEPAVKTIVNVGAIQGPTGIGMAHLMEADKNGTAANEYEFTVSSVPSDVGNLLASGNLDIAAVPTNLAAALYQKTQGKVQLLAVNTLGVLYMLDNGNGIDSIEDLKGKTIYSTGEGANPEYILRYVLNKNGLDPDKDVTIEFLAENTELVAKMVSGDITLAMVPEPNVSSITAQNKEVTVALSMNTEWEKVAEAGSKLMMGCVAVRKEFLETNKTAVDAFLAEYKSSIEKTADVDTTATLCESYGIIPKAALAKKAIPNCQLTFVSGADMKAQIAGYYQVLFDSNPKSIGGKLPDDAFYYVG
ncbi:MAG: ABC transporter substrate-binding protein [Clostridia bacterium]|nr:ABC transporter substrate-binding protein [Clostridia bacterium]